jgi:hypothetical protein
LEAAIIERVRNSSLVEPTGADNVTRLKQRTEAEEGVGRRPGRGAFGRRQSRTARTGGADRSANAGMSSAQGGANPPHRQPEGSWAPLIDPG